MWSRRNSNKGLSKSGFRWGIRYPGPGGVVHRQGVLTSLRGVPSVKAWISLSNAALAARPFWHSVDGRRRWHKRMVVECGIQRQQLRTEITDKVFLWSDRLIGPGGTGSFFSVDSLPAIAPEPAHRNCRRDHATSEVQGILACS
jgi:hypothetical protein